MSLIQPFEQAAFSTMAQAPTTPWRTDEDALDYRNDPKEFLLERCALWLDNIEVFHNWVITATYYMPDSLPVRGSDKRLIIPDKVHDEALWQGKVGLVIAKGPLAFVSDGSVDFKDQKIEVGDWVVYDIIEGRQFTIDRIHCRRLKDTQIVMRVKDPRMVY